MSFFSRLFGRSGSRPGDLDQRLQRFEDEADAATPGYVGTSYNRAGDLAWKEGQQTRAIQYFGRAIDAFLQDGQREAARGVANKIIRVRPRAVRTLCTLTWLDLAVRHSATALLHLRDYVEAAQAADQSSADLAALQIYEMARIVPESEIIGAVADALDQLDHSDRADEVRKWMATNGSPDAVRDHRALTVACMEAAVQTYDGGGSMTADAPTLPEAEAEARAAAEASGEEGAPEPQASEDGESSDAPDADAELEGASRSEPKGRWD